MDRPASPETDIPFHVGAILHLDPPCFLPIHLAPPVDPPPPRLSVFRALVLLCGVADWSTLPYFQETIQTHCQNMLRAVPATGFLARIPHTRLVVTQPRLNSSLPETPPKNHCIYTLPLGTYPGYGGITCWIWLDSLCGKSQKWSDNVLLVSNGLQWVLTGPNSKSTVQLQLFPLIDAKNRSMLETPENTIRFSLKTSLASKIRRQVSSKWFPLTFPTRFMQKSGLFYLKLDHVALKHFL